MLILESSRRKNIIIERSPPESPLIDPPHVTFVHFVSTRTVLLRFNVDGHQTRALHASRDYNILETIKVNLRERSMTLLARLEKYQHFTLQNLLCQHIPGKDFFL